ncbi:MAG: tyrosine-type recombinase/integrase [Saezia sp.]
MMALLSDVKIRKAQSKEKIYTLNDGDGLILLVNPNGSKIWRFRFSWGGKQQKFSLGSYPSIDLKTARLLRSDAQTQLAKGIDPREERKLLKEETLIKTEKTFAEFAMQWQEFRIRKIGVDRLSENRQSTAMQIRRYMDKDFFPALGHMPLSEITRADVLKLMRSIENRGALAIAAKCRSWLNEIFRHALVEGLIVTNPASDLDIVAMPAPPARHNPYSQFF